VRAIVLGTGAVGARAARQLASSAEVDRLQLCDRTASRAEAVVSSLGPSADVVAWSAGLLDGAAVLVVAAPGQHVAIRAAVERGVAVVSVVDDVAEVEGLLALDTLARARGVPVVVGAGMAPGLTCVLAGYAASAFARVEEIHVAKSGTGGPACARQHHRALGDEAIDWRDDQWVRRRGGSGRELCWFPDPVGGRDCYRAGLPDALLLVPAFKGIRRATARMAASRRDRMTATLPMLRAPHPEGEVGAIRVEVRGVRGDHWDVQVLGVIDRPAVAAGAVAAVSAVWAGTGRLARHGAGGLAELVVDPAGFLAELNRRGVKAAVFEGARS
jgi:saccharopine dehydrogenase-like NADP-dependent oxidoreductase